MDISKLIADLSALNVEKFEGYGIKVHFHNQQKGILYPHIQSSGIGAVSATQQFEKVNPDLKPNINEPPFDPAFAQSMDGELNYDKMLNWSASPDQAEQETPLTGDAGPLTSN